MMAEFYSMPLATDAYLADTRHLTRAQHGSYVLLLMESWRRPHCNLPDDDTLLARLAGCTPEEWKSEKSVIMDFWTLNKRTKTWTQKRQIKEREYVAKNVGQKRHAARSRWNKKEKDDAAASSPHMRNGSAAYAPTPTPTPNKEKGIEKSIPKRTDLDELKTAFDMYNEKARTLSLSQAQTLTEQRKKKLRQRLKECGGLKGWEGALEKLGRSRFLNGDNDKGWQASFDFLLQASSFTKLMEGTYDGQRTDEPQKRTREELLAIMHG